MLSLRASRKPVRAENVVEQNGQCEIAAPRDLVWSALQNPDVLAASIPGCKSMRRIDATHYLASVQTKVGPVSASFEVQIDLQDIDPPNRYTLSGEGKGVAGFAKGQAEVDLIEAAQGTLLKYRLQATVGGKLAQVGSRLIDGTTRKLANEFFANLVERIADAESSPEIRQSEQASQMAAEQETKQDGATADTEQPKDKPVKRENDGQLVIWSIAFGVLILAMVLAY